MTSFVVNTLKKRFYLVVIGIIGKIKYPLRKLIFQTAQNFGLNMTRKELSTNNENTIFYSLAEESIVISKPYNRSDEIPRLIKIGTFTLENLCI